MSELSQYRVDLKTNNKVKVLHLHLHFHSVMDDAQLANSALTEEQKTEVLASLKAEADRLRIFAVDPDNPVPPL